MPDTFWTLLHDRAHWEFEIFLIFLFDIVLAGLWQFFVRLRRKPPLVAMKTPEGVCDGCGGTVRHLIESGIRWCLGCGDIRGAPSVNAMISTDAESGQKPAKNHANPRDPDLTSDYKF
jgi:hypothetical protein